MDKETWNKAYKKFGVEAETITINECMIIPSKEGGYLGFMKDAPGVCTQGETKEEVIENIKDAYRCMIIFDNENR
jgi:hypothetical protein